MSKIYNDNKITDVFAEFANDLGINFYSDFDINYLRYKGLFEDPNDDGDITFRFDVDRDELTDDVIRNIMDSVRETFGKGEQ